MTEGHDVYSAFLESLLEVETSRKSSLEQRGISVITTSGALVTLLFGSAAIVTSSKTFKLPQASHGWLIAALVLFVFAAAAGIIVNVPLFYGKIMVTEQKLKEVWEDTASEAQAAVAAARLKSLHAAQAANDAKAWILVAAGMLELAAVSVLAVSIIHIIQ